MVMFYINYIFESNTTMYSLIATILKLFLKPKIAQFSALASAFVGVANFEEI